MRDLSNSQPETTINHFSHPHPLHLSNHQPQQTLTPASCAGCKQTAAGWIYSCTTCSYILHIKCSQMPQQIRHPFDQHHVLSLSPTPTYPGACVNCDACGKQGISGFSYHCRVCDIDLHMLCASAPLLHTHQSHHHQLNLTFSPPYQDKSYACDICNNKGSNHWLYRCSLCEFDAHLNCALTNPRAPAQAQAQAPSSRFQVHGTQYAARPNLQNQTPHDFYANLGRVYGSGIPGARTGQENVLLNQAMQLQSLANDSQAQIMNMLQGFMGGGSGGGNFQQLQGLMGGGVGGGGGLNLLQGLMGDLQGGNIGGGLDVFGANFGGFDGGSLLGLDSLTGIAGGLGGFLGL